MGCVQRGQVFTDKRSQSSVLVLVIGVHVLSTLLIYVRITHKYVHNIKDNGGRMCVRHFGERSET